MAEARQCAVGGLKAIGLDPLEWVLRNKLKLTGTNYGCGSAQCGTLDPLERAWNESLEPINCTADFRQGQNGQADTMLVCR
jgi:xanthine dehydrogenase iron-sulfur cluster and FAD-binding subunit A